jgi:hypothetical protein
MNDLPLPGPPHPRPELPPPPPVVEEVSPSPFEFGRVPSGPPPRRSLVVGLLLVAALVGSVAAVWVWVAQPPPCEGTNVRSDRFGYCLTAPEGWRLADVQGQELAADQLFRPGGATTLMIQAVETSMDLDAFVDDVRGKQEDEGYPPGDVSPTEVAGVEARRWDAELDSGSGSVRARTVVFVRDGVAWRVQFADEVTAFSEHESDLTTILASWRFA